MNPITRPLRSRPVTALLAVALLVAGLTATTPTGDAAAGPAATAPSERYIVRLATDTVPEPELPRPERAEQRAEIAADQAAVATAVERAGGEVVAELEVSPFSVIEATPADAAALEASPAVEAVVPDALAEPHLDASRGQISAEAVWPTTDGTGQTVAVLDTGVDTGHDFLSGEVVHEACFADDDGLDPGEPGAGDCPNGQNIQIGAPAAEPCDQANCNHGTHVAGIVGGDDPTPTPADHSGVAPGADLMAIQVFHDATPNALAWFSDIALGLEHVYLERTNYDIAAVNLSLGAFLYDSFCDDEVGGILKDPVADLVAAGIPVVSSSGNDGQANQLSYPACMSQVISVGNVLTSKAGAGLEDEISNTSNSAPFLRLLAPGAPITSATSGGASDATTVLNGTSMASAHAAGALALLAEAREGDLAGKNGTDRVDHLHGWLNATGLCIRDDLNGEWFRRIDVNQAVGHTTFPSALFWDVPPCSWYETAVDWIAYDADGSGTGAEPIASGYPDGTYRAGLDITRAQVGRMVWRLLGEQATSHEHPFTDVPAWVEDAVDWLNDPAGPAAPDPLMAGFADNTFRPDDSITRGQVARLLYRALGSPDTTGMPAHGFTDVPGWLEDAVTWIAHDPDGGGPLEPVATGYPDDTFRPDNPITRAELTRMLFRFNDQLGV